MPDELAPLAGMGGFDTLLVASGTDSTGAGCPVRPLEPEVWARIGHGGTYDAKTLWPCTHWSRPSLANAFPNDPMCPGSYTRSSTPHAEVYDFGGEDSSSSRF